MAKWVVRMSYGQDKFIVDADSEEEAKKQAIELSMQDQKEHPMRGEVYDVRRVPWEMQPGLDMGEDHAA